MEKPATDIYTFRELREKGFYLRRQFARQAILPRAADVCIVDGVKCGTVE